MQYESGSSKKTSGFLIDLFPKPTSSADLDEPKSLHRFRVFTFTTPPGTVPAQNKCVGGGDNGRDNCRESLGWMQFQVTTRNIATSKGLYQRDIICGLT